MHLTRFQLTHRLPRAKELPGGNSSISSFLTKGSGKKGGGAGRKKERGEGKALMVRPLKKEIFYFGFPKPALIPVVESWVPDFIEFLAGENRTLASLSTQPLFLQGIVQISVKRTVHDFFLSQEIHMSWVNTFSTSHVKWRSI